MKKQSSRGRIIALITPLFLFTACIPSLQPLYTDKDLVFEEKLLGSFSEEKENPATWTFRKGVARDYHLVIKDANKSSPLSAHLFKLDSKLYLDLYPENEGFEDWAREDFFKSTLVPAHIFFAVSEISPVLKLRPLQEDWLKEYLEKNKKAVPYTFVEKTRLVFTGSTDEMQNFLKKIASEAGAWGDPGEFPKRDQVSSGK